jgi:hypothetical protein
MKELSRRAFGCAVGCLLATLLAAGCAVTRVPVDDGGVGLSFASVEIDSPPGGPWTLMQKKTGSRRYGAFLYEGTTTVHHVAADAFEMRLGDEVPGVDHVRSRVLLPALRHVFGRREVSFAEKLVEPDPRFGDKCVRFIISARDYEAPGRGGADYLDLRMWGYAFVPPDAPKRGVVVAMNVRGQAEDFPKETEAWAETFFEGVRLR